MLDELKKSIHDGISARINSPLYGALVVSWTVIHWQVFAVLFFVDEERIFQKTGLLKSEFIYTYLLNPVSLNFYWSLFVTFALTALVIWIFPKYLTRPAYRQQEIDVVDKEIIRIKEQIRLREEQNRLSIIEIELNKQKKERAKQEKEIEETKTQKEKWEEEFKNTKKDDRLLGFISLADAIYKEGGEMYSSQVDDHIRDGSKFLAYADTRGLVDTGGKNNGISFIQLTEKGKHFYRLFSDSEDNGED